MNSRDPPSRILLLIITYLPPSFPLTNDYLFETFKHYGEIKKILIFERGKTNKAFVEYHDVKHAILARRDMMGKSLTPQGGRLLIHFSRLKQLNLEVVDHTRGSQYDPNEVETKQIQKPVQQIQMTLKLSSCLKFLIQKLRTSHMFQRNLLQKLSWKLDEDYANEVAKSNLTFFDENQQLIHELLAQKQSKFLKVSNIDERVTPKMLYNLFNRFGHLEALLLSKSESSAILQFTNSDNACIAKELLNNILFFNKELRILYHQSEDIQGATINQEYFVGTGTKFKVVPLSKTLVFSGIPDLLEVQDMVKLVGRISEIKLESNQIQITLQDIYEALKVISVFSEYEYKGKKINLNLK